MNELRLFNSLSEKALQGYVAPQPLFGEFLDYDALTSDRVFCFDMRRVGADITVLREREVDYDSDIPRKITEVLVRKVPDNQQVTVHFCLCPVTQDVPCS